MSKTKVSTKEVTPELLSVVIERIKRWVKRILHTRDAKEHRIHFREIRVWVILSVWTMVWKRKAIANLCVKLAIPQWPDSWSNIILDVSLKVFFRWDQNLNPWMLRKAESPHPVSWRFQLKVLTNKDWPPEGKRNFASRWPLDSNGTTSLTL